MIAITKFVFVRNCVNDCVHLVNIRADANRFRFNAGIDFGNGLDVGIDRLRISINVGDEVGQCADAKVHPFAEVVTREVAQLQVVTRIQSGFVFEGSDCVIVKAGPGVFPTFEVRHPIRDVYIYAINTCASNLANALHVDLAPFGGEGTDPNVFISLLDPECRAAAKKCRFTGDLALQPVGMVFRHGVWRFISIGCDALGARDVHECMIAGGMRFFCNRLNGFQLFGWVEETLVASGNIVVDLDAKNMVSGSVGDDFVGILSV